MVVLSEPSLKEIKEQLIKLGEEVNQLTELINEKSADELEKIIISRHLRLYADHEDELLPQKLERCLNINCVNNQICHTTFRKILEKVHSSIKTDSLQDTYNSIFDELGDIKKKLDNAIGTNCYNCYSNLEKELIHQWSNLEKISGKEGERNPSHSFDIENTVENILKPLSHTIRLTILVELGDGSAGFSELSEKTGTKGGHLIFHLDQLLETGLVVQNKRKSYYNLTSRGEEVLSIIKEIR